MMMNKEPNRIIVVLDFLSKQLDKFVNKKDAVEDPLLKEDYKRTKKLLGIERTTGENEITMFYNVKCKVLDDKSLLDYIDSQSVRFSRQREELIELSVKIADLNHKDDKQKAKEEIINHYKAGLSSGVGLRDMITIIKERYPWTPFLKKIMILVSLVSCLIGIGLSVLDLYTDIEFSLHMLNGTIRRNSSNDTISASDAFLEKHYNLSSLKSANYEFFSNLSSVFKRNKKWDVLEEEEDFLLIGRFALWHCIQPFVVTMIVFIFINYKKVKSSDIPQTPEAPEAPDCLRNSSVCRFLNKLLCSIPLEILWPLGYVLVKCLANFLLSVGSVVPIPALTNVYRFSLEVRSHIARSQSEFKTKIVSIEKEMRDHEAIGKL